MVTGHMLGVFTVHPQHMDSEHPQHIDSEHPQHMDSEHPQHMDNEHPQTHSTNEGHISSKSIPSTGRSKSTSLRS